MGSSNCQQLGHIIEVNDLSYSINGNTVIEDVSFQVHPGEYLGLIGPNGGGKTTLLKLMLGLLKPDRGTVKICGHNVRKKADKSVVGYVPQRATQTDFNFPATVEEIVTSGRTPRLGWFRRLGGADHAAIDKAMEMADVTHLKKRLIQNLSGGERQRVFIARALACEPKILFLDEPTSGVDVASQNRFYQFLSDLNKKLKLTIVFVSHDIDAVSNQVSCVLCLNKKLVCHGPPRDYIKEDFLKKLYGTKVKFVMHGEAEHQHEHLHELHHEHPEVASTGIPPENETGLTPHHHA